MADWSLPTITDLYTNIITYFRNRDIDNARMFSTAYTIATNVETGTIRWNNTNKNWEIYNSSAWSALSSLYSIAISGNAGSATKLNTARTINGTSFDGTANVTVGINIGVINPSDTVMYPVIVLDNATGNKTAQTDPAYRFNATTAELTCNSFVATATDGLQWESGRSRITHNDGGGNCQIRFGHKFDVTEVFTADNSGAAIIRCDIDSVRAPLILKVANNSTVLDGDTVTWGTEFKVEYNGLTWGGVDIVTVSAPQNLTNKELTSPVINGGATTLGTKVNYSGVLGTTGVEFSIPSWAKQITLSWSNITNGQSGTSYNVKLGHSGGYIPSSSRTGTVKSNNDDSIIAFSTTGQFNVSSEDLSADDYSGSITLTLIDPATNTWVGEGSCISNKAIFVSFSGYMTLSSALDRILFDANYGTGTAGMLNIAYS